MASPLCGEHTSSPRDHFSCHCRRTALTPIYKHGTERGGRCGVVSRLQQQCALGLCSVFCWSRRRVAVLLAETQATLHPITC